MDGKNVAAQEVNTVDSCKNDANVVPVDTMTGKGEAVSEVDENLKNGEISSKYAKSIPITSLCWYVATVKLNREKDAQKLMENLGEPIEVWVPGLRKVDKDNDNVMRANRFDIYSFVFFRFKPFAPENELPRHSSVDFQSQKNTGFKNVRRQIFNNILSISSIQGILKIPGEKEYAPIPAYQIDRFRRMIKEGGQPIELVDEMISVGQRVRLVGEEFQGMEGVVDSINQKYPYIYVVLDYLGCAKVKVERNMIEPICDNEEDADARKGKRNKNDVNAVLCQREITEAEWLSLHPYDDMMPVDKQYVAFANSLLSYLDNGTIGVPRDKRKSLALAVASYVEDKRSNLRLFASFVAVFRQKKEHFHPVELLITNTPNEEQKEAWMAEYSPTKINAIDLSYLLMLHSEWAEKDIDFIMSQGTRLGLALRNLGCEKLQRNSVYADECRNLLLDGWKGFKQFLYWLVNGNHYLSSNEKQESLSTILSEDFTIWGGVNPRYLTLTFARKSKVGDDIVSNIEKLKALPSTKYDVLDDDYGDELNKRTKKNRKKKRFLLKCTNKSHTSKQYPVLYDEISTRKYVVGETYLCQLANYGKDWYLLTPPIIPLHKVLTYRDITAENLALMTDEEFINANHAFIDTINKHKEALVSNKWLSNEDIDAYIVAFRKAEDAKGNDNYPQLRKEVEKIIANWNQGDLNPNRTDVYDDVFYEITDSLYLNMQHTDYLTDEQWYEKYKDLTPDKRSEVVELRKAANDYVDFPNPYRKEMEAAWQLPDGYENDQLYDALSPLAAYMPKAMSLYENGEATKALGISFDLFDMIIVSMSRELKFFFDDEGGTTYSWALAEVSLYPICKIYNDKSTSQEVKTEIFNRIEAYGKTYSFPKKLDTGHVYDPVGVFSEFGTFERELDFYDFFGLNPYNINEPEEAEALSDEEFESWRLKIFKEVSTIGDYHKLSTEELSNLSTILMDMYLFPNEDIEQACSVEQFKTSIDSVKTELLSRLAKSQDSAEQSMILQALHNMNRLCKYDFTDDVIAIEKQLESKPDDNTIQSWATTQNKNGSWTGVSADEAYRRIIVLGNIAYKVTDVNKDRISFLAYNYYSPTPCTTAKELHAKFMAYETKYRRPDEEAPSFAHRQAIAMLQSESLPLADRLLLYDILL